MTRQKIGMLLMIAGLSLTLFLIGSILIQDACIWSNNLNTFAQKYDSFYDMIVARENGSFMISIAAGFLLFIPGCFLRFAPKSKKFFETDSSAATPYNRNHREII